jgi:hypothetical protein
MNEAQDQFSLTRVAFITCRRTRSNVGSIWFFVLMAVSPVLAPAQFVLTNTFNIPDRAYYYRFDLTNVVIPDGVTNIGWGAFAGCSNLTHVTIGKGVTTIKGNALATTEAMREGWVFGAPLTNAVSVCLSGDRPPNVDPHAFDAVTYMASSYAWQPCNVTVYARPGTKGWLPLWGEATLAGKPVWYAEIRTVALGQLSGGLAIGLNVWGNTNTLAQPIVFEATDDFISWRRLSTNAMYEPGTPVDGPCTAGFAEPTTNSARFYRVRAAIDWP